MEKKYKESLIKLDEYIIQLQKIKKVIKILDSKYKNKLIHISDKELNIEIKMQ